MASWICSEYQDGKTFRIKITLRNNNRVVEDTTKGKILGFVVDAVLGFTFHMNLLKVFDLHRIICILNPESVLHHLTLPLSLLKPGVGQRPVTNDISHGARMPYLGTERQERISVSWKRFKTVQNASLLRRGLYADTFRHSVNKTTKVRPGKDTLRTSETCQNSQCCTTPNRTA